MAILSGQARVAGIIGWPVGHSRSPRLHGYWLEEHGIDGAYIPLPISPERFGHAVPGPGMLAWERRDAAAPDHALIVNTTSLGMEGKETLALDLSRARAGTAVADIVYVPLETPLLADAKARGLRPVEGLGMLLWQGIPGFKAWFGVEPTVDDDLRRFVAADLLR